MGCFPYGIRDMVGIMLFILEVLGLLSWVNFEASLILIICFAG
jgi:hypothetical protein